jgi:hypothetical protein
MKNAALLRGEFEAGGTFFVGIPLIPIDPVAARRKNLIVLEQTTAEKAY